LNHHDTVVTGTYRCTTGNVICRNLTEEGTLVASSVSGNWFSFRIAMPEDLSSCFFNGRFSEMSGNGDYSCYQGGRLVEVGVWKLTRVP